MSGSNDPPGFVQVICEEVGATKQLEAVLDKPDSEEERLKLMRLVFGRVLAQQREFDEDARNTNMLLWIKDNVDWFKGHVYHVCKAEMKRRSLEKDGKLPKDWIDDKVDHKSMGALYLKMWSDVIDEGLYPDKWITVFRDKADVQVKAALNAFDEGKTDSVEYPYYGKEWQVTRNGNNEEVELSKKLLEEAVGARPSTTDTVPVTVRIYMEDVGTWRLAKAHQVDK
jgi:hypothetical protein